METSFSGLGKIPVVQDETEVDAREEIPDYGKYLGGEKNCYLKGQLMGAIAVWSHCNTQCILILAFLYLSDLGYIFLF